MAPKRDVRRTIKAVIFDLDGTLIDTIPFHAQSFRTLFRRLGHPIPMKKIRPLMRHPTERIFAQLRAPRLLHMDLEKLLELRREEYYALLRGEDTVCEDVFACLRALRGYKLGIATNSSRTTLEASTPNRLMRFFDAAISYTDVLRAKPDPEMLLALARKLRVKPAQCAMIGDSVMDVRAAKNAGMLSIGLYRKTGASHLSELREEKPDFLVKRLDRIPRMLKTATADATRARA